MSFQKHLRYFACGLLMTSAGTQAQFGPRNPSSVLDRNRSLSFETVVFPEHVDTAIVHLHYRLAKNFFIMVQSGQIANTFRGRGELMAELLNEHGLSSGRSIRSVELLRNGGKEDSASEIQDAMRFAVPSGKYRVVFEMKDLESGRTATERGPFFSVRTVPPDSLCFSTGVLFDSVNISSESSAWMAANLGGASLYGNRGGVFFAVTGVSDSGPAPVEWVLAGSDGSEEMPFAPLKGSSAEIRTGVLHLAEVGNRVAYTTTGGKGSILSIPLPFEKLEPGDYELTVKATIGKTATTRLHSFRVVWPGKPASLGMGDLAVDAMRHIATTEEMDEMTSFSTSRSKRAFREFWKKRDPDTSSAYNEVMAEYFRRVDETIRKFSTSNENDGYKTDRGRIFVLFGTPARTERMFRPTISATEIWYYPGAKKRFIFTDPNKTGNYLLTGWEPL